MTERQRVETMYADLRETDLVIDKAGNAWPIADLVIGETTGVVAFWLLDPVTKVKQHLMNKMIGSPVAVSRVPSHADEAAKLEAEFPKSSALASGEGTALIGVTEAVAALEAIAHPEPEVEYTAKEFDAAQLATEDVPVSLPSFGSMTPLEQRSHLFLLHGVLAYDLKSREELAAMHLDAHRQHAEGKLKSKHVPHVHEAA